MWRDAGAGLIASWTTASTAAALSDNIDSHNEEILAAISTLQFAAFFSSLEEWHRRKWIADIQRATKIDVSALLGMATGGQALTLSRAQRRAGGVVNAARVIHPTPAGLTVSPVLTGIDARLADAVAKNASLVRSVSDDTRARIANAVFSGLQSGMSKIEVARQINKGLKISSKRSRAIAQDQVAKGVKMLTTFRLEEAGFEDGIWMHSGNPHPRLAHLQHNGHRYKLSDPIWNEILLPNCGCWQIGAWNE